MAATPTAAAETPVATPVASETVAPSVGATTAASAGAWKIGVVTDVGTVDDKNFNQFSFEGAEKGAADIGASSPTPIVPKDASEYASDIGLLVGQKYNIIVTVGFNLAYTVLFPQIVQLRA